MKLSILAASTLFFTLAQSVPVTIDPVIGPTDRHIIRHTHKVNCLNCFCGHKAIARARHACPMDRDLILCPPSIPIRACYRCACYQRVPVLPSPPMMKSPKMKPHPEDDLDEADEMMMQTPDADDDMDAMSSTPMPTMKPHPMDMDMNMKPHSTMMPKATHKPHSTLKSEPKKPHPTMKSEPKKPHPTMKSEPKKPHPTMTKHAKKTHTNMMSSPKEKPHPNMTGMPTKKAHPTMTSMPPKPQPTMKSQAQTPTPSPKACASFQRGGGGGNTMFDVDLREERGTFKVSWQMDSVPDMIEILYEDKKIFTTKVPVSGHGSAYVKYSGTSTKIRVWVTSPTSGTGWFLMIGCPKDDH